VRQPLTQGSEEVSGQLVHALGRVQADDPAIGVHPTPGDMAGGFQPVQQGRRRPEGEADALAETRR